MVWLKRAHRSKNLASFILWIPLVMSLFSTEIDAKTNSTTVSTDNQLSMGLLMMTVWLVVAFGHCGGQKMPLMASIMVQIRCTFFWTYLVFGNRPTKK